MRPERCRPVATARVVVAALVVALLDPREQEHLVVHRQPEREDEDHDRHPHLDRAEGVEAEQPGQVAVLEDPHQRAEGRAERQRVHHQRLDGTSTEPVIRNSSTNVASAISAERPRQPAGDLRA